MYIAFITTPIVLAFSYLDFLIWNHASLKTCRKTNIHNTSYDFHSECSQIAKLFKLSQVFVPLLQYINRTQNTGHIHQGNFEWKTNVRRTSQRVSENFQSFLSSGGNKLKLSRMTVCMVWEEVIGGGGLPVCLGSVLASSLFWKSGVKTNHPIKFHFLQRMYTTFLWHSIVLSV